VVLQLAAIVLAAFLAAEIAQQVMLGQYGFKLGSFELSAVADASTAGLDELKHHLAKLREDAASNAD
jgi:hypothetical protein